MADAWGTSWGVSSSWGSSWIAGFTPAPTVTTTVTAAGKSSGGKRKRKVIIGDRVFEVDSLREVERLLERVVEEEPVRIQKIAKKRLKVVDRVVAKNDPAPAVEAVVAPVAVDWSPLWNQLAKQDAEYARILAKVLADREEDDIETIILMLH